MAEINSLNVVDASNTARFPEDQPPSTVNNGARALEGIMARWHKDTNGSKVTTGSANAYVFAANQTLGAYYDGLVIVFDANFLNTGPATLNVDGLGAKAIKKHNAKALIAGDIEVAQKVFVIYDGNNFQMISQPGLVIGDVIGPAGATANALAQYDGTTGKLLKDGVALGVADTNVPQMDATGYPAADGSQITALNATALTSGTVPAARIPNAGDAAVGGLETATKAEMESGTAVDKIVTPGRQQSHASAVKAWAVVDRSAGTPSLLSPSYNITSVTDDGSGNTIVTIATDFSSSVYAVGANGTGTNNVASPHTIVAGAFDVELKNTESNALDSASFSCWAFGDQ